MTTSVDAPLPGGAAPDGPIADEESQGTSRRKKALLIVLFLLLAALIGLATWYVVFRKPITELPLPGVIDSTMPTYGSAIYGAKQPAGIAVTPSGDRIYVAQTAGTRTLLVYDGQGNIIQEGSPKASTAGSRVPVYVAVNPVSSEVYVSDRPSGAIYIYDSEGVFNRQFKPDAAVKEWAPLGLAFDPQGNLYVGDVAPGAPMRVLKFDPDGKLLQTIGADEKLDYPNGISIDSAGHVIVADGNNGRLLVFDGAGKRIATVSRGVADGQLGIPRGTAIDDKGRVAVVDATAHQVHFYTIDAAGVITYVGSIGSEGRQEGAFAFPTGVAADARGRLYVTDTLNDRVQVWSY